MAYYVGCCVFQFNGMTPGLYTRRMTPPSPVSPGDQLMMHNLYLRAMGVSLPAITVQSAEVGVMIDPLIDSINGWHRFPIGTFTNGMNVNISPQELSFLPPQALWMYMRLNGTAAPSAKLLAMLSYIVEIKAPAEVPLRHALPIGPIRTTHLPA